MHDRWSLTLPILFFKHKKARYKGLEKNDAQLNVLFALNNLYMVKGKLCP
jgi:IS5 family transposase